MQDAASEDESLGVILGSATNSPYRAPAPARCRCAKTRRGQAPFIDGNVPKCRMGRSIRIYLRDGLSAFRSLQGRVRYACLISFDFFQAPCRAARHFAQRRRCASRMRSRPSGVLAPVDMPP